MTTFTVLAARAYLDAAEQGKLTGDDLALENDQLVAALDEVNALNATPVTRHDRAERGRLAVEMFGMKDDIETLAADVIADILHWVALTSGDDAAAGAHFRSVKYYLEEAR